MLSVAAFYTAQIQINYIADLVTDGSVQVRKSLVAMLTSFLTEMGDRYDHQTRLLPYILDLLSDEAEEVASAAIACLARCGQEYESEHRLQSTNSPYILMCFMDSICLLVSVRRTLLCILLLLFCIRPEMNVSRRSSME